MTKNEKYSLKIVPPFDTLCVVCDDDEATVYCRMCNQPMCDYCRSFGTHGYDKCDNETWQ